MSFFPAGGSYRAPPNHLAGYEVHFEEGTNRGERKRREKKRKERDGRKHPLPEIKFCLRS